jgi:DNA-binding NarL/FixJ family response regulator
MIRVILADDQALVRAGFRVLLGAADDIDIVGEAGDGQAAVDLARSAGADVVLMDIRMPGVDGLEATRRIAAAPDLADLRVLVLTTFEADEYVFEALRSGASGFLVKDTEPEQLLEAVRVVARGEALLSPSVTRRPAAARRRAAVGAHRPGAGGARTRRHRDEQRRDRRRLVHEPAHGQDPREPGDDQARRPRPRPAGRHRLRDGSGEPRPELTPARG